MNSASSMSSTAWALLIILSLLWGGSFFFVEIALRVFDPLTIVFGRVALAGIALFAVIKLRGGGILMTREIAAAFAIMGLLNNIIPFALLSYGQTQIGAGLASILNATTPAFTVIVAHFMTSDEQMTPPKIIGVFFGFAGVAVLIGADALQGLDKSVIAMGLCLGAALSYAFAAIYGRRFKTLGVQPVNVAFGQVTASAILTAPLVLIFNAPTFGGMPDTAAIAAMIGLGLFSTALAYVLFFRILEISGATNLTLVTFLIPVSSMALGAAFLGEKLLTSHLSGLALIALGLAAIDGRAWRSIRQLTSAAKTTTKEER